MGIAEFIDLGTFIACGLCVLLAAVLIILRGLDYLVLSGGARELQTLGARLGLSEIDSQPFMGHWRAWTRRWSLHGAGRRLSHGLDVRGQGVLDGRRLQVHLLAGPFWLDRFGGARGTLVRGSRSAASAFHIFLIEELALRWRGRYYVTVVDIAFPRSLGSGLRVRRIDLSGYGALRLGDDRLDAHYEVLATHPEAARALVLARPVRLALLSALDAGLRLDFDGRGITAELPGCAPEANGLLSAVGSINRLADALSALAEEAKGAKTERIGSGWPPTGEPS